MKVCCVLVTYGNRFELLEKVLDRLHSERIDKVIVVDNGSALPGKEALSAYCNRFDNWLKIVSLNQNTGSANGFAEGITSAGNMGCEFIWLLDDDNLPEAGALDVLKCTWIEKSKAIKPENLCLCSFRTDRTSFQRAILEKDSSKILPPLNNFMGFHVKDIPRKLFGRIAQHKQPDSDSILPLKVDAATYGGLFIPIEALPKIGLPNRDYLLYMDDFAFTKEYSLKGGEIWIIPSSIVKDIEPSYYLPARKNLLYHSALDGKNESLVYYAFRNGIWFTKKYLVTSKPVYFANKFIFYFFINFLAVVRGKKDRMKTVRKAMRDGENGILGISSSHKLP